MNYYEHHLGDYVEATAHLSMVEDGAYGRLLRKYYATEKPLPGDIKHVQRLVSCRSASERAAVDRVLKEFFVLQVDGWHQERCDREIARYRERQNQQRSASALGVKARLNGQPSGQPSGQSTGQPLDDHAVNHRLTPPDSRLQSPSTIYQSPPPTSEGGGIVEFGIGPGKKRFRSADEIEAAEREAKAHAQR